MSLHPPPLGIANCGMAEFWLVPAVHAVCHITSTGSATRCNPVWSSHPKQDFVGNYGPVWVNVTMSLYWISSDTSIDKSCQILLIWIWQWYDGTGGTNMEVGSNNMVPSVFWWPWFKCSLGHSLICSAAPHLIMAILHQYIKARAWG